MAFAFDTLGYAKHLEGSGVDRRQAEAHAQAVREFIMAELVTKQDLAQALEHQALQVTVRLATIVGGMITVAVAIIGLMVRFLH